MGRAFVKQIYERPRAETAKISGTNALKGAVAWPEKPFRMEREGATRPTNG